MYEDHYHVLDDPFRFTPDEHKPYQHHSYLSGVAFLQHVLDHSRKVMILIYGATGVGKSTLVNDILRRQDPNRVLPVKLKASTVNSHGVIESVTRTFELLEGGTEAEQLTALNDYLVQKSSENLHSLFVIEDAHELSADSLNKLGQLVRLIWENCYKMKIFLIGSPVLDQLLYQSKNDVLQKKILIGWNQHGMGDSEISGYVAHRIRSVGGTKLTFEDIVWRTLYDFTDGIPRRINRICNKLLLNGFIDKKLSFVNADILDAVRQLDNEGLLEVKKSFATLHGLKGTSNSHLDEAIDMEVGQFAAGFSTPSLIEKFLVVSDDDDGDDEDAPVSLKQTISPKIPVVNERFNPASEVKIPEDLRHQATFDTDESSWFSERKTAIFATLGLVGILVLVATFFVGNDSEMTADAPIVAMQDKVKSDVQTPSAIDNERDTEHLTAAEIPEVPEPAVAKEEAIIQPTDATETETPAIASAEVNTAVSVAEEDIDESGQVEERARLAREKALAEEKAADEEARKALKKAAIVEETVTVQEPRYTTPQMKNMLLSGIWYRSGRPAVLFPSQLNTCTESRLDIFCRATETITQVDNKKVTARTGAMFHHFTGDGEFNVSYRRSAGIESGQLTSGNDLTEYQMTCRFIGETVVDCYKDGNRIKFLRR